MSYHLDHFRNQDEYDMEDAKREAADQPKRYRPTFSQRNRERCESPTGFNHKLSDWSLSDWMTATVGEIGEAANIVKKLNRVRDGIPGNDKSAEQLQADLADEIADAAIYLDLLAQAAGLDLETIIESKFARTSAKIGYAAAPAPVAEQQTSELRISKKK